jgi:antitoxin (DNA-binding transcriptional repressor) of toxin-antitoxin stability system
MGDPRDDLRQRAREDGIEFFFAMFVDMHGKPCAKLIPASSYDLMMPAAPSEVTMTGAMPVTRIVPARPMTNAPRQSVSWRKPPAA